MGGDKINLKEFKKSRCKNCNKNILVAIKSKRGKSIFNRNIRPKKSVCCSHNCSMKYNYKRKWKQKK